MLDEKTVQIPEEWLVPTVANEDALMWSPGRYRLCFEVASGGMATVYLALYHGPMGFEKVVALKTIHKHLAKEKQFLDMFFDEARIAAHINHPYVCRVIDFGQADAAFYIAMEYLMGEPVSAVWTALDKKPGLAASHDLPFLVARLGADLAEGLHAAHELTQDGKSLGIVHRDVSPANLFVLFDGSVRVVDFGIAKAENKLHQTEAGLVKGKFAYVSPEQLKLESLDRRSDIWGLGVVMWELLTGQRLFKRDSPMETMQLVTSMEIPPPSELRKGIPRQLDAIVLRALARNRDTRFDTGRAMAVALERFLGAHGRTVPKAEVSEWLEELFPGAAAKKLALIELTRKGDTAVPIEDRSEHSPTAVYRKPEPTMVKSRPSETDAVPIPDDEEAHAPGEEKTKGSEERPTKEPKLALGDEDRHRHRPARAAKRSSSSWMVIVALLAVGVGGALAYYEPWEETQVSSPEQDPEPASGEDPQGDGTVTDDESTAEEDDRVAELPIADGEPGELSLSIRGDGWADVYERGELLGRTPLEVTLPSGLHRMRLHPMGASEDIKTVDVEVRPGRSAYVAVSL